MSTFTLLNCTTFVHGYDFTTDLNQLTVNLEVDEQETTTFQHASGSAYRTRVGGLRDVSADLSGFWQSGLSTAADSAPDAQAFPDLGIGNRVITATPADVEAQPAYMFQAGKFSYELGGAVGEVLPFTLAMMGTDGVGVVRGQLAKTRGNVSATGVLGSVLNLGAPTSTQYVYATLHVFSPGTTITVQVQSDDGAGFASPTTRATIGPLTAQGGTWMTRVQGPFTGETHWRMNVSAITGTFNVAGAIGVQ